MKAGPEEEKARCSTLKSGRSEETLQIQARNSSFDGDPEVPKIT